jgi:hypothetical protein
MLNQHPLVEPILEGVLALQLLYSLAAHRVSQTPNNAATEPIKVTAGAARAIRVL